MNVLRDAGQGLISNKRKSGHTWNNLTMQCFGTNKSKLFPELEITPVNNSSATNRKDSESRPTSEKEKQISTIDNKMLTKEENDICFLYRKLPYLNQHFHLHRKIGEGTFSSVYLATLKNYIEQGHFAVKYLTQALQESRIERELQCLQEIGGHDNVVGVNLFLRSESNDCVVFVMPYLAHKRFSDYILELDWKETVLYMKNLFIALKRVHSFGIIHRDVKPGNFLYNRDLKQFLLIDFGLAQPVTSSDNKEQTEIKNIQTAPIDYSIRRKRKLVVDETDTPTMTDIKHAPKRLALQPKDNNVLQPVPRSTFPVSSAEKVREELKSPPVKNMSSEKKSGKKSVVEKTPSKQKNNCLTTLQSSLSRKKLFTDENLQENFTTRVKSTNKRSFTPLASRTSCGSFIQVCNSRVVEHRPIKDDVFQKPSPILLPTTNMFTIACNCSNKGAICNTCLPKKKMIAPRAGTPGFRPPEVLFKYPHQTTAVDMWAAGVVLLCILSGSYPFFKSPNDLTALAEIMTIFGKQAVSDVAVKFGKKVICTANPKELNLSKLCKILRARALRKVEMSSGDGQTNKKSETVKCGECNYLIKDDGCLCLKDGECYTSGTGENVDEFPDSAYHLLSRLLDLNPDTRITASEALQHPFITN